MIAGLVVLTYLAGVVAALHAATRTRTSQGAIAWALSLLTFPFLALPAYLVFGRNKFSGRAAAFRERQDEFKKVFEEYQRNLEPHEIESCSQPDWHVAIERLTELEFVGGNDVSLLINGDDTFASILAAISTATDYILFQFYMINNDELGCQVRDALTERAAAGVRVYVLYDEIGSLKLDQGFIDSLELAGIKVSAFKPTRGRGNRFQINFRNHRKMVVVDGAQAWVGGHNVGDAYMGRNPEFSPWRDTHVRLEGPVVMQVQLTMLGDWYWATREIPEVNWTPAALEANKSATMLPTGPDTRLEHASLFFVTMLNNAHERAWLSAAYFVPDDAVMKALQLAALRGVDVRIITTAKSDSLTTQLAGFYYISELRDLGIGFYAYKPGFMHQKVLLVDQDIACVGSHNLDNRSFRLNFEVGVIILDKDFNTQMECMFLDDFDNADVLDPAELATRPWWWRQAVKLARLAAPVL